MGQSRSRQARDRRGRRATGRSSACSPRRARAAPRLADRRHAAARSRRAPRRRRRPRDERQPRLLAATASWPRATTRCTCSRTTTAASATTKARTLQRRPRAGRVRRRRLARRPERLLRPALSRALPRARCRPPCDLLSVPSAFTYTTGAAHWEVLLRARAIENQCYVVAAGAGRHARERPAHLRPQPGRRSLGRGRRLSRDEGEGVVARRARAASGSPRCAASCPRSSTGSSSDGVSRGRGGDRASALALLGVARRPTLAAPPSVVERQHRVPRAGSDGRLRQRRPHRREVERGDADDRLRPDRRRTATTTPSSPTPTAAANGASRSPPGATTAISSRRRGIPAASCWRCWSSRTSTSAARSMRSRATAPTPTTGS